MGQVLQRQTADPVGGGLGCRHVGEVGDQGCFAETGAQQGVQAGVGGFGDVGLSGELSRGAAQLQHHGLVHPGGAESPAVDLA
jgi:hypothetical protein